MGHHGVVVEQEEQVVFEDAAVGDGLEGRVGTAKGDFLVDPEEDVTGGYYYYQRPVEVHAVVPRDWDYAQEQEHQDVVQELRHVHVVQLREYVALV